MKVGVIGNGGREHALCSSLKNSDKIKKISLENLTYWSVEDQEAYFSYVEASIKRDKY